VNITNAVVSWFWVSNGSSNTILESLSFWSIWTVLKVSWSGVSNFTSTNIWWDDVLWPWFLLLRKRSIIKITDAVESRFWVSYSSCNTILKGLSLWSIWAMFKSSWCAISNFTSTNVWWDNVLWPWFFSKRTIVIIRNAIESSFWECNSSGDTILKCLSFWPIWAMFKSGWWY